MSWREHNYKCQDFKNFLLLRKILYGNYFSLELFKICTKLQPQWSFSTCLSGKKDWKSESEFPKTRSREWKNSSLSLHDKAISQIEVEIKNSIEVQRSKQEVLIYCLTHNKHFINWSDCSHTKSVQVNLDISCWHKPPGGCCRNFWVGMCR